MIDNPEMGEEKVIEVLRNEAKKRRESIVAYREGGREERVKEEERELKIIGEFLPPELSDEELEAIIAEGHTKVGALTPKDFGKLMGWVMGRAKGRASGERVSSIIKRHLTGS